MSSCWSHVGIHYHELTQLTRAIANPGLLNEQAVGKATGTQRWNRGCSGSNFQMSARLMQANASRQLSLTLREESGSSLQNLTARNVLPRVAIGDEQPR